MSTSPQSNQEPILNQEQKTNDKEYNFAQLRKKAEQVEFELTREREERARLVTEIEALKAQRQGDRSEEDEDDLDSNEPYIDKKTLKRYFRKEKENSKKEIQQTAEQIARRAIEEERKNNEVYRIKTMYPDFNEVLNEQTAQKLSEKHPELADKILKVADESLRKEMAYQTIKSLNLHKPEAPKVDINAEIAKRQRTPYYFPSNHASPPASVANDFSETSQKQAYEKMRSLIKGRRG